MKWNTTKPPKRKQNPVIIRFKSWAGHIGRGKFVWSESENAFIQCIDGPDGIGLYDNDYTILGWK